MRRGRFSQSLVSIFPSPKIQKMLATARMALGGREKGCEPWWVASQTCAQS